MREIGPRPTGLHPHPAHWEAIRKAAFERDDGCRGCGQADGLEVHHRTYERWGAERVNDVTTLCRDCHDLITGAQMRFRDDRRVMPTERVTVQIERFEPKREEEPPEIIRGTRIIERVINEGSGPLPPPIKETVKVQRTFLRAPDELPPQVRNNVVR